MLYLVIYVRNKAGEVNPIEFNVLNSRWEDILNRVSSYIDIVRATLEFKIVNRTIFEYCIKNGSQKVIDRLKDIMPFVSYGGTTTGYNVPKQSLGFIDRKAGIRVEYMNDRIKMYQL